MLVKQLTIVAKKQRRKKQQGEFVSMVLCALGTSLLGNIFASLLGNR